MCLYHYTRCFMASLDALKVDQVLMRLLDASSVCDA